MNNKGYTLPKIFQLIIENDAARSELRNCVAIPFAPYKNLLLDVRSLREDARRALSWSPGGKKGAMRG